MYFLIFFKERHWISSFVCGPLLGFPGGSDGKASACRPGDLGSVSGLGRSPRGGNGNPLQYSCLENPMDREAWSTTVHGIAKSQTRLSDFTFFMVGPKSTAHKRRYAKTSASGVTGK